MQSARSSFVVKLLHSRQSVENLMLAHLIIKLLQLRIVIVFIKIHASNSIQSHFSPVRILNS